MKLLEAKQIREWDRVTAEKQKISSTELMERAAGAIFNRLITLFGYNSRWLIVCGRGNNGGDGFAIARFCANAGVGFRIYLSKGEKSGDNAEQLRKLEPFISESNLSADACPLAGERILDCLYGSGLNKALAGKDVEIVEQLNTSGAEIISVDIPSGMPADLSFTDSDSWPGIVATCTFTFQLPKLSFFISPFVSRVGRVEVIDLRLTPHFILNEHSKYYLINNQLCNKLLKKRAPHAHKGIFGHSLLIGGQSGVSGAINFTASACVKAGSGLTTVVTADECIPSVQQNVPEAMCIEGGQKMITYIPEDLSRFSAFAVGPGLGIHTDTAEVLLKNLARMDRPVIDADALNILSFNNTEPPAGSIITPHPKEFDRLFGRSASDLERFKLVTKKATELTIVIVLKGAVTMIALPDGRLFFNSSGNVALAKGGSGDMLTGIICALMASGHESGEAAILGVYIHGLAADIWLNEHGETHSLTATELSNYIGKAIEQIGILGG